MSTARYLAAHLERHCERLREAPITTDVSAGEIRAHLASNYSFETPLGAQEVIEDVGEMLWQWSEHATNPRHFGLFRPCVDWESIAADALVAAYDPNLATYDFSPAAQEIESHVLNLLADRFGLPASQRWANYTSGGQEANHTAVSVALTHTYPEIGSRGLRHIESQPVFYLSQEGHHSFEKVAHNTGLGRNSIRWIPATRDLQIDVDALEMQIRRDRSSGLHPFLVIGTAGTTNAGVIDPLPELASVARRHRLWLHVDAAWGGAVVLSEELRTLMDGIDQADSITCDAHKWLSVATGAGMFFCRHPEAVRASFGIDSEYVPQPRRPGTENPLSTSMQWSRRLIGLKLFMVLARQGVAGVAGRIERQTELGELLRELLRERGFKLLNSTRLPVVCFTHSAIENGEIDPATIVRRLADSQTAWISKTVLRAQIPALRACISNFRTGEDDLLELVDGLVASIPSAAKKRVFST